MTNNGSHNHVNLLAIWSAAAVSHNFTFTPNVKISLKDETYHFFGLIENQKLKMILMYPGIDDTDIFLESKSSQSLIIDGGYGFSVSPIAVNNVASMECLLNDWGFYNSIDRD